MIPKYVCIIEVLSFKAYFESHLIYKWLNFRQTIFNQLNIMVSYVGIIGLCQSVKILRKLCEVAALPFQAHANYGTWSIIAFAW